MSQPPESPKPKTSSRLGTIATLGFSAACLVALVWLAGREGLQRLSDPNWAWLAASAGAIGLFLVADVLRFDSLLSFLGLRQRPGFGPLLYASAFGLTAGLFVTSGVGQLVGKPGLLHSQGRLALSQGFYASLVERLLDVAMGFTLFLPLLVKLTWRPEPFGGFYILVFFLVAGAWALAVGARLGWFLGWLYRLINRLAGWAMKMPFLPRAKLKSLLSGGSWQELSAAAPRGLRLAPPAWSVARVVSVTLRLYLMSLAFDLPVTWQTLLLGTPIIMVSAIVAITPGSLGFLDAGLLGVLALGGVSMADSLSFLLAFRLTNFLFMPLITLGLKWLTRADGPPAAPANRHGG